MVKEQLELFRALGSDPVNKFKARYIQHLFILVQPNLIALYNFRVAASNYLINAGETHGTVEIKITVGKFFPNLSHSMPLNWQMSVSQDSNVFDDWPATGNGPGYGKAWGCDLSYDYVKINAEYTT